MQNQRGSLYHSSWAVDLVRVGVGHGAGSFIIPPILIHPMKTGMTSLIENHYKVFLVELVV